MLNFEQLQINPGHKSVFTTHSFRATPEHGHAFNIVCMKLQDVEHIAAGKVNFYGYEKPKFGTYAEKVDVWFATWVYGDLNGTQKVKPLVGNFNGGFAQYREAVDMCERVWQHRANWLPRVLLRP